MVQVLQSKGPEGWQSCLRHLSASVHSCQYVSVVATHIGSVISFSFIFLFLYFIELDLCQHL